MSLLSKFFSNGYTSTAIDGRIAKLDAEQVELEQKIVAADGRVVEEMLESGNSPSAKVVDELRREIAQLERVRTALEQERGVVAGQEEQVRIDKAWRAAADFRRHFDHHGPAIEAWIEQGRVMIEVALLDARKLKKMSPLLPEGIEHSSFLDGGLLSAVLSALHSDNFRQSARSPSVAAMISEFGGLCLREAPDPLRTGTQLLLKNSPSHDAPAKAERSL